MWLVEGMLVCIGMMFLTFLAPKFDMWNCESAVSGIWVFLIITALRVILICSRLGRLTALCFLPWCLGISRFHGFLLMLSIIENSWSTLLVVLLTLFFLLISFTNKKIIFNSINLPFPWHSKTGKDWARLVASSTPCNLLLKVLNKNRNTKKKNH